MKEFNSVYEFVQDVKQHNKAVWNKIQTMKAQGKPEKLGATIHQHIKQILKNEDIQFARCDKDDDGEQILCYVTQETQEVNGVSQVVDIKHGLNLPCINRHAVVTSANYNREEVSDMVTLWCSPVMLECIEQVETETLAKKIDESLPRDNLTNLVDDCLTVSLIPSDIREDLKQYLRAKYLGNNRKYPKYENCPLIWVHINAISAGIVRAYIDEHTDKRTTERQPQAEEILEQTAKITNLVFEGVCKLLIPVNP